MGVPTNPLAFPNDHRANGMTLRDWIAGQILAAFHTRIASREWTFEEMATDAYVQADAMLAAREDVSPYQIIERLNAALYEMTDTYWGVADDRNGDDRGEPPMVIVRAREALAYVRSKMVAA